MLHTKICTLKKNDYAAFYQGKLSKKNNNFTILYICLLDISLILQLSQFLQRKSCRHCSIKKLQTEQRWEHIKISINLFLLTGIKLGNSTPNLWSAIPFLSSATHSQRTCSWPATNLSSFLWFISLICCKEKN